MRNQRFEVQELNNKKKQTRIVWLMAKIILLKSFQICSQSPDSFTHT